MQLIIFKIRVPLTGSITLSLNLPICDRADGPITIPLYKLKHVNVKRSYQTTRPLFTTCDSIPNRPLIVRVIEP